MIAKGEGALRDVDGSTLFESEAQVEQPHVQWRARQDSKPESNTCLSNHGRERKYHREENM